MIIQIFSALVKETGETINKIRRYILFENLLLCRYQMHHPRSLFTSINVCHPPSLHHLHHHPLHIQRRPQFPVCGLSFATFLRLNLRTTARRGGRVLVSISCAGAARRGAWAERSRREPGGVLGVAPHSLHTAPSSYSRTSPLPRTQCSEF